MGPRLAQRRNGGQRARMSSPLPSAFQRASRPCAGTRRRSTGRKKMLPAPRRAFSFSRWESGIRGGYLLCAPRSHRPRHETHRGPTRARRKNHRSQDQPPENRGPGRRRRLLGLRRGDNSERSRLHSLPAQLFLHQLASRRDFRFLGVPRCGRRGPETYAAAYRKFKASLELTED